MSNVYLEIPAKDLNLEQMTDARNSLFLNDYIYLEKQLLSAITNISDSVMGQTAKDIYTNEVLQFDNVLRVTAGPQKFLETFGLFIDALNRCTFEIFSDFNSMFNENNLTSYSSLYLLYKRNFDRLLRIFDSKEDLIQLGAASPVIGSRDMPFVFSVEDSVWKALSLAQNREFNEAIAVLDRIKDEIGIAYYSYKVWILGVSGGLESQASQLYNELKTYSESMRRVHAAVFKFAAARSYMRLWKYTGLASYLDDFKFEFQDAISHYKKNSFEFRLNEKSHLESISAREKTYAPMLLAFAYANKELF